MLTAKTEYPDYRYLYLQFFRIRITQRIHNLNFVQSFHRILVIVKVSDQHHSANGQGIEKQIIMSPKAHTT